MLIFKSVRVEPNRNVRFKIITRIYKNIFGKYTMKEYFESFCLETKVEITKEQYEKIKTEYLKDV